MVTGICVRRDSTFVAKVRLRDPHTAIFTDYRQLSASRYYLFFLSDLTKLCKLEKFNLLYWFLMCQQDGCTKDRFKGRGS